MPFNPELNEELNLLVQFNLGSTFQGIKVHGNADNETIAACKRLFEKGLINQVDGGYLKPEGIEAAEHAHSLLNILRSKSSR
mgnify:CR=1 FL=1|tara:strand:- start:352 stop:597 length:246 start_codon:yes stop_codon:yes gene_type:complete